MYVAHLVLITVNILISLIGSVIIEWRTGLTSMALIPLLIVAQGIQLAFVKGFTETKDKIYSDSSQIINESVMNIRTVYSLGSAHMMT